MTRRKRLQEALGAQGYDAFVVTQRANQLYYVPHSEPVSGLPPIPFLLLAGDDTVAVPGAAFYYACRDHLTQCEVAKTEVGDPPADQALLDVIKKRGFQRVAFDHLAPGLATLLGRVLPAVVCIEEARLGAQLRRTKEPGEMALMRATARISDLGMEAAFRAARPGATNRDVAAEAAAVMVKAGCEEAGMQVVSGPGTAYMGTGNWVSEPRRLIQEGDMVLVDMGILYHGYLGDQTRTAIVGEGTAAQRELIQTVQHCYRETVKAMKPGARTSELYQITLGILQAKGWRHFFPHHISHGLGLGGDLPRINVDSDDVLQVGDTLSCEPGVYIPGLGGARFENMLSIGEQGAEELTQSAVDPCIT